MFFLLLLPSVSGAFPARVVSVADGDTLTVEPADGGDRVKVRLYGVDAPERKQPYGEAARVFAFTVALYQRVDVEPVGKPDRYGRVVAVIFLPSGESLQAALLKEGFAWVWPQYCRNCREWQGLQDIASLESRGLWAGQDPLPPWEWRRQ